MPLYVFHCEDCDLEFEQLLKWQDSDPDCPNCANSDRVTRLPTYAATKGHSPIDSKMRS